MDFYDVVVIGAGPAGSVAAAYRKKQKRKVLVLEKEIFPRFVIGESLLPSCMEYLEESDLLNVIKKGNFQVKTGATFYGKNRQCSFFFPTNFRLVGHGLGK